MDNIVWNIIQIQHGSEELWPRHGFRVCVHCDLDIRDMTLGEGHDTPLGHGRQVCEILSRSNMAVRSYGPDMDFGYLCTVTLTLEIWPWVKVMTHPWVMDNNCVKYYPDQTSGYEIEARTRCEQTDRVIPIYMYYPNFFCGGCNNYEIDRTRTVVLSHLQGKHNRLAPVHTYSPHITYIAKLCNFWNWYKKFGFLIYFLSKWLNQHVLCHLLARCAALHKHE